MAASASPDSRQFVPPRLLRNGHLMTLAGTFWLRRFPALPRAALDNFPLD